MAHTAAILQEEVKAGGRTQLRNGGEVEGEDLRLLDAEQEAHGAAYDGIGAMLGPFAFIPVLELDKGHAAVLAATGEAKARHRQY